MNRAPFAAAAVSFVLAACSASAPAPAMAPTPGPTSGPAGGVPVASPPPCPQDVAASAGTACSFEGQACRDDAKPGLYGILCRQGVWTEGEMPHPPCCKK